MSLTLNFFMLAWISVSLWTQTNRLYMFMQCDVRNTANPLLAHSFFTKICVFYWRWLHHNILLMQCFLIRYNILATSVPRFLAPTLVSSRFIACRRREKSMKICLLWSNTKESLLSWSWTAPWNRHLASSARNLKVLAMKWSQHNHFPPCRMLLNR